MRKGFSRLRIGGLTLGAASTALAGVAQAAPTALPNTMIAGGYSWFISNTTYGTNFGTGLGIAGVSQTASPGLTCGFFGWTLSIDRSTYFDPDGIVDLSGTTLKGGPQLIGRVKTKVHYFFHPDRSVVRALYTIKNTGTSTTAVLMNVDTELCTFGTTTIEGSEDGDRSIEPDDSWFITNGDPAQPTLTWGRGDGWSRFEYPGFGGSEDYTEQRTIVLGPGERKRVVFFIRLSNSPAAARATAGRFDNGSSIPTSFLSGLGATKRAEVINYDLPPP